MVQAFVRQAMGFVEDTPDRETKEELIKTLQTVTEGKVSHIAMLPPARHPHAMQLMGISSQSQHLSNDICNREQENRECTS